ncbi:MAG: AAA family ATPase [Rubrivivax sp.]|nr:AAA family ATPase [Rubrivivax sp.]
MIDRTKSTLATGLPRGRPYVRLAAQRQLHPMSHLASVRGEVQEYGSLREEHMKAEWFIGLDNGKDVDGPLTLAQIDERIAKDESVEDKLFRQVREPGIGLRLSRVRYSDIPRFNVEFRPEIEALISSRQDKAVTVLSGSNNSGKSLVLKHLFASLGPKSCLLTCNRLSSIDVINSQTSNPDERRQLYDSFIHQHEAGHHHEDLNARQLDQLIRGLNDEKQDKLFEIAGQLLGSSVSLQKTDKNNRTSPWYVDIDGQSLKYSSSGTRLLFTLLGNLLDEYFPTVLIDEPELGLSPRIQGVLAHALYDAETRKRYFPHLKQVFVVTHSHLFLDRDVLSNNHIVEKAGDVVSSRPVQSIAELHQLQFGMLGNDLEHLFMPAAVVVVEGPCDTTYLARLFMLQVPSRRISIVVAHGDGGAPDKVHTLAEGFGDLHSSPYRARLFVILDAKHSTKKSSLIRQGVLDDRIQVWKHNGIEWYYPKKYVAAAFRCDEGELLGVDIGAERITVRTISMSKIELANAVAPKVTANDSLDPEIAEFIEKVKRATA